MPRPARRYPCTYEGCESVFNRPYRLAGHLLVHENKKPYPCEEADCGRSYTNRSHLVRHINSTHKKKQMDLEILFICPICKQVYSNRQNVKRHIKLCSKLLVFTCDHCQLEFKKKTHLLEHMYTHTGVKAFECKNCHQFFDTNLNRNRHLRNHKDYQCNQCPKVFSRWSLYLEHKRNAHDQNRVYACDICPKWFKVRDALTQHLQRHLNGSDKPKHKCPFENCERIYTTAFNLTQHINVKHYGRTYPCHLCNTELTTNGSLQKHIRKMHNSKQSQISFPKPKPGQEIFLNSNSNIKNAKTKEDLTITATTSHVSPEKCQVINVKSEPNEENLQTSHTQSENHQKTAVTSEPNDKNPATSEPNDENPDTSQPTKANPDTSQPNDENPDTSQRNDENPDTSQRNNENPDTSHVIKEMPSKKQVKKRKDWGSFHSSAAAEISGFFDLWAGYQ